MNRHSRVSVITPFFNAERFLRDAIDSVFAQTFDSWELLLVDDGSKDGSVEIAHQYAERDPGRVRYFEHEKRENRGTSASRNLALRHATGEYIALLDGDDIWLPQKLERQTAIMRQHRDVGMVYGATRYWHSWTGNPEDLHRDHTPKLGLRIDTVLNPPALLTLLYPLGHATAPCPSDIMLRREVAESIGGFEEAFTGCYQLYEDQAFLAKVYLDAAVYVSDECWDLYRQHPASCMSIVQRTGQYDSVRAFFLNWLEQYFVRQGVKDRDLWNALRRRQRHHRYPKWSHVLDRAQYGLTKMMNFLNRTVSRSH